MLELRVLPLRQSPLLLPCVTLCNYVPTRVRKRKLVRHNFVSLSKMTFSCGEIRLDFIEYCPAFVMISQTYNLLELGRHIGGVLNIAIISSAIQIIACTKQFIVKVDSDHFPCNFCLPFYPLYVLFIFCSSATLQLHTFFNTFNNYY